MKSRKVLALLAAVSVAGLIGCEDKKAIPAAPKPATPAATPATGTTPAPAATPTPAATPPAETPAAPK